jgi:hypothetical protein
MNKVQFKLVVPADVRDIVRLHADQHGTDMSATITTVVREVLLGELDAARVAALERPVAE